MSSMAAVILKFFDALIISIFTIKIAQLVWQQTIYYLYTFVNNNDEHYNKANPNYYGKWQKILIDIKWMLFCNENS